MEVDEAGGDRVSAVALVVVVNPSAFVTSEPAWARLRMDPSR